MNTTSAPAERSFGREFVCACGFGMVWAGLTFVSLPPMSLWWLGLVAPLPLAVLGWTSRRAWSAALGAGFGSAPFWIYHHAWVADVSLAGVFPLVAYLAVWPGLAVLAIAMARRAFGRFGPAVLIPTVWVGFEVTRGELLLGGYSWFLAGHATIESVTISRAASIGGVYLVSWLVVAISGIAVASRYGSRSERRIGYGVSVVLLVLLVVSAPTPSSKTDTNPIRVAAIQTNVPQNNKVFPTQEQLVSDFRTLIDLAESAVEQGAELIVTPETVLPGGLLDPESRALIDEPFGAAMLAEQERLGVPMLVGCTSLGGVRVQGDRFVWDETFNSVFLVDGGQAVGPRYDKLRPTPFGETLPYVQSLPWLRDLVLRIGLGASGMDFGLTPGDAAVHFDVPTPGREFVVVTPICFESSMAPTVRKLVNEARRSGRPAELLAVVTNDGWFGSFDTGRAMHVLQARWRCVEHNLPMIRTANTGVSAAIDRSGRVVARLDARASDVQVVDIEAGPSTTLYQRVGDSFGWLCAGLTWLGLLASRVVTKPKRRSSVNADTEAEKQTGEG